MEHPHDEHRRSSISYPPPMLDHHSFSEVRAHSTSEGESREVDTQQEKYSVGEQKDLV